MLSCSESGEVDSLVFNSCSQSDLSGLEDLSHGAGGSTWLQYVQEQVLVCVCACCALLPCRAASGVFDHCKLSVAVLILYSPFVGVSFLQQYRNRTNITRDFFSPSVSLTQLKIGLKQKQRNNSIS